MIQTAKLVFWGQYFYKVKSSCDLATPRSNSDNVGDRRDRNTKVGGIIFLEVVVFSLQYAWTLSRLAY